MWAELYKFSAYISYDDEEIYDEKPEGSSVEVIFKHPEWWRYNDIVQRNSFMHRETQSWSLNYINKQIELLNWGLIGIIRDGEKYTKKKLPPKINKLAAYFGVEIGERLSQYYDTKIKLTEDEIYALRSAYKRYSGVEKIQNNHLPYPRIMLEVDLARRIGGWSRKDIMSLSKKDFDSMHVLQAAGMKIPLASNFSMIAPRNNGAEDQIYTGSGGVKIANKVTDPAIDIIREINLKKGRDPNHGLEGLVSE